MSLPHMLRFTVTANNYGAERSFILFIDQNTLLPVAISSL